MIRKSNDQPERLIDEKGIRLDGRKADELRPIKIEVGVLWQANGSAYMEQGGNKILAAVYGPREIHPRHLARPDRAVLRCMYRMVPFSVAERKSPAPSRRETELSMVLTNTLEPSAFLEQYPRTVVDVFVEVLEADGGTRCTAINCASLALADAGIPLRDLTSAVAGGKADGRIIIDLSDVEDKHGEADVPIAMMLRKKEITLFQMDGRLTVDELKEVLEMGKEGMNQIYELQRDALKKRYTQIRKEVAKDDIEESGGNSK
ncbi:MAG: exosome complex exonuclease Rrp41 [Promethearchaeota archaeon]